MNIIKYPVLLLLFLMNTSASFSQTSDIVASVSENNVGKKVIINSSIMGEERGLQIYLPESYGQGQKKYPVLYILDGQYLFFNGVSAVQTLAGKFDMMPEMIVVGITNNSPQRYSHLTGTKFMDFLEKEVLTYIDATYRTTDERVIFGWQHAGTLIVETLIRKPHLFDANIIADPFPLDGKGEQSRIGRLEKKITDEFDGHLFFGVGGKGGMVVDGTNKLASILTQKAPKSFTWDYVILSEEEHRTVAAPLLPMGLRHYFQNYSDLYLTTLDAYKKAGGLDCVQAYFKKRGERYGFSPEISSGTMWSMVSRAIIADDFDYFVTFMNEFRPKGFIRDSRIGNIFWYADYYAKYRKYDEALSLYQEVADKYADSAPFSHKMGKIYQAQGDMENAEKKYQKAITLAQAANDAEQTEYEKSLASLRGKNVF